MAIPEPVPVPAVAPVPGPAKVPQHQWTHKGDKVLLVKCVDRGGVAHGGFVWPKSGKTVCPKALADRKAASSQDCESGGLFGWAWGINLGGGKTPDYRGDWLVFSADPADVIDLGGKQKVIGEAEVVYYGDCLGALMHTLEGRIAWVEHNAGGQHTATGGRGSASATGWSGSASATGESGSASATGWSGIAALSGDYGNLTVGPKSLGAVTANRWTWHVQPGAVVACRWKDADGNWQHRLLVADDLGLKEGAVEVRDGNLI